MTKVFIDSDILLDYFFMRQPFYESATKLLDLCANKKIEGYTTPLVIANVYNVLRKEIGAQELKNKLKSLLKFLEVISMSKDIILKALNSDFKDFEDALQNFSAIEVTDIPIILTRNEKDYKKSTLSVFRPQAFLKTIN